MGFPQPLAINYGLIASTTAAALPRKHTVTILSGTSWNPPAGVTSVIATLFGGGTGSAGITATALGSGGQKVTSTVAVTPGVPVTLAIGAGSAYNSTGGTTTFTGATSALGGNANSGGAVGQTGDSASNWGVAGSSGTPIGGNGKIELEYWV